MDLDDELRVFSGSSNPELAKAICDYLHIHLGRARIERFPDGERIVRVDDDVRGRDCFVVQSTCRPQDEHLMELLIFLDCLRRASARRVTAVIPYFGYARQDRKEEGRVPITAKLVANLLTTAGADRILAVDLHAPQLQGFFDIPVDHLTGELILARYFQAKGIPDLTVVATDVGNIKTAARYSAFLGAELAIVHKKRLGGKVVVAAYLIGMVKDRNILMCDDMISTGDTVCTAAALVKEHGARTIYVGATHGVFAPGAMESLSQAPIDEVVVTDTIPSDQATRQAKKIKVLSAAPMLGEAIRRIHMNESVSILFTQLNQAGAKAVTTKNSACYKV